VQFRFAAKQLEGRNALLWFLADAPSASLETVWQSARRKTASFTTIPAIFAALRTSHACSGSTLRQVGFSRNGKIRPGCAEPVEDETSLWKEQKKFPGAAVLKSMGK
jgi:hypothetical protein